MALWRMSLRKGEDARGWEISADGWMRAHLWSGRIVPGMKTSTKTLLSFGSLLAFAAVAVVVQIRNTAALWLPRPTRDWTCPYGPYAADCELNQSLDAEGLELMMSVDEALGMLRGTALLQKQGRRYGGFASDSLGVSFEFASDSHPALPGRVVELEFSGATDSVFGVGVGSVRSEVEAAMASKGYGPPRRLGEFQRHRKGGVVLTYEFERDTLKRVTVELRDSLVARAGSREGR